MSARYIIGDTRDVVASLPDGSVDLVLTSPPFLALRSYLPADHPDKHREIGSEATPAEFLDVLLELTAEWRRVLAPHGSIAVELGDTYSGSGGAGGDYTDTGLRAGQQKFAGSAVQHRRTAVRDRACGKDGGNGWPLAKSLCLVPEMYRLALAYGRNILTGTESPAGRWRVRNVVRWVRPNPPVGALGDKYRPATSDLVIACTASDRWFDLDAVRQPYTERAEREKQAGGVTSGESYRADPAGGGYGTRVRKPAEGGGAPPLDWWCIPPGGYPGSHYAVYPPELCRIPIESMCPRQVCTTCGQPRRRITEQTPEYRAAREAIRSGDPESHADWDQAVRNRVGFGSGGGAASKISNGHVSATPVTVGWTDCGHDTWRPGIVLDPFAGSGTTLMVATGHGRDAIGIDLDERNADLARERIGMFLTVEHHDREAVS